MPNEIIFGREENSKVSEIKYKSYTLEGSLVSGNMYKVERIISTNPRDYLNEEISPGKIITVD